MDEQIKVLRRIQLLRHGSPRVIQYDLKYDDR